MRLHTGCLLIPFCVFAARAFSASTEEPVLLRDARTALGESIPQVAIQKLRTALRSTDLAGEQRAEAIRLLAEAQRSAGDREKALQTLERLGDSADLATRMLRAEILASALRWSEAHALYVEIAAQPDAPLSARLGLAESWQALGDTARAIQVLEPLAQASDTTATVRLRLANLYVETRQNDKARAALAGVRVTRAADGHWQRYIEGRILLSEQPATALAYFEQVLAAKTDVGENLRVAATLGVAEARVLLSGYEAADKGIETFIWDYPDSVWLELLFRRLDQIYARQHNPEEHELQEWAAKPQLNRAALARYYVARLQLRGRKMEKAFASLNAFVQRHPTHQLLPNVQLMRADMLLAAGSFGEAVRALEAAARQANTDEQRGEIELRTGLVHYRQGEFLLAASSLERAGERSKNLRDVAQFNAALAWLHQGNNERFLDAYRQISAQAPDSELRGQLVLEQGLLQARQTDSQARVTLERFLRDFPRHSRRSEARLALAELMLAAGDAKGAGRFMKVVGEKAKPPSMDDQADYFGIFLADAQQPRDDREVIKRAIAFLSKHGTSPLLPEVRMKLGQVYFRQTDYPNAETQFATLARESPASPYAETALFLAGQSAMQMIDSKAIDRALDSFGEVAKLDGPLKLYARQQQAIIKSLDRESEAVVLYDLILTAQPPPEPELRFAAICGMGDNLLALGRKDPPQIEAALAAFDRLASIAEVPTSWRNQALYKKAKALEQLGRVPEAAEIFWNVVDQTARSADREYFWFYKAGFDAARIYEQKTDWKAAIGVYEKMAKLDGPRAEEARTRARQVRLEHFIWE